MSAHHDTVAAHFASDITRHQMEVVRDDGVHRHLIFKRHGDSSYRFELVTFPGYLVYVGDMGAFTFRRLLDMFEFFRTDAGRINPSYWSSKLDATDRGGAKEHDSEAFTRMVCTEVFRWMRDTRDEITKEDRRELWEAVNDEILVHADDHHRAGAAAYDFSWRKNGVAHFTLEDIYEHDMTRYTHRFLWCCHALAWGIARYDEWRAAQLAAFAEGGAS